MAKVGVQEKAHPRSHEAAAVDTSSLYPVRQSRALQASFLCGKCRQHHGPRVPGVVVCTTMSQYKTLNTICASDKNDKSVTKFRWQKKLCRREDPHAMEMIYYSSHILVNSDEKMLMMMIMD
jgi:hypothetical protein